MTPNSAELRLEVRRDIDAIRAVNDAAFGQPGEGRLVDLVRADSGYISGLSIVAVQAGAVVGHILCSRVTLRTSRAAVPVLALAPMAVTPVRQRQGVGSALVREALARARRLEWAAMFVLGHPEFYPRFGFAPASTFGATSPWEVPDEVFMAIELRPGLLTTLGGGRVEYPKTFDGV